MTGRNARRGASIATLALAAIIVLVLASLRLASSFQPLNPLSGWGVGLCVVGATSAANAAHLISRIERDAIFGVGLSASLLMTEWSGPEILLRISGLVFTYLLVIVWCEITLSQNTQTHISSGTQLAVEPESRAADRLTDGVLDFDLKQANVAGDQPREHGAKLEIASSSEAADPSPAIEFTEISGTNFDEIDEEESGIEDGLSENATQWCSRSQADDSDVLEGWIRVQMLSGQKSTNIHIPFAPPFAAFPDVECEPLECESDVSIRPAEVFTYGMRLDVRRSASSQPETVMVGYQVASKSPSSELREAG